MVSKQLVTSCGTKTLCDVDLDKNVKDLSGKSCDIPES